MQAIGLMGWFRISCGELLRPCVAQHQGVVFPEVSISCQRLIACETFQEYDVSLGT